MKSMKFYFRLMITTVILGSFLPGCSLKTTEEEVSAIKQTIENHTTDKKPNLLFVMADQWRRQAIGCMNEDPVLTPNIDRFVDESLFFTNALSVCPLCVPARASMWTGRYPVTTTVTSTNCKLPDREISIANILNEVGYHTGYIGKWHLDGGGPKSYVAPERRAGFKFWHANNLNHNHYLIDEYTGIDTHIYKEGWQIDDEADAAINYINEHKDEPFALFVSWAPPHPGFGRKGQMQEVTIYTAPEKYEAMYQDVVTTGRGNFTSCEAKTGPKPVQENGLPGYFGAITNMDENFGRLMETLKQQGIADNTIVVLTSDHGDMLGSQDLWGKQIWYEESIGIPFIIKWSEEIKSGRNDVLFNQIDILPSLLGLMNISIPERVQGINFASLMQGKEMEEPEAAFIFYKQKNGLRGWRCVRTKKYSYVIDFNEKINKLDRILYDLEQDPYQMHPITLGEGEDKTIKELEQRIYEWLEKTHDPFLEQLKTK